METVENSVIARGWPEGGMKRRILEQGNYSV